MPPVPKAITIKPIAARVLGEGGRERERERERERVKFASFMFILLTC